MIFVDIETIPTQSHELATHVMESVDLKHPESIDDYCSPPASYKKQETIDAYVDKKTSEYEEYIKSIHADNESKKLEELSKQGLSGLFGEVLCIGYAVDDEDPNCLYINPENGITEASILSEFRDIACYSGRVKSYCSNTLVGHSVLQFDIPFLSQRMMINGLPPLFRHGSKPWDLSVEDTKLMWQCSSQKRESLHNLCIAFGIQTPKDGIDGSQVYQAFLDGRHDEIAAYCKRDVVATRELHKRMSV